MWFLFAVLVALGNVVLADEAKSLIYGSGEKSPGPLRGTLFFNENNGKLTISGTLSGLPRGVHGFHIHEKGELGNKCLDAGPHFNPTHNVHGAPDAQVRHVGDLGNINVTNDNGEVQINIVDSIAKLSGEHGIIGRTVVIHEKADDLGLGGQPDSKKTGNAGSRIACGLIAAGESNSALSTSRTLIFLFLAAKIILQ